MTRKEKFNARIWQDFYSGDVQSKKTINDEINTLFHIYPNNSLDIYNDESINFEFSDEAKKNGVSNIKYWKTLDDFIDLKNSMLEELSALSEISEEDFMKYLEK